MSDLNNSSNNSSNENDLGNGGNDNDNLGQPDENHGEPDSSSNNISSEGIAGPSEYELRQLANIKRNEDRLKQLGLAGTWKEQMKKRAGGGAGTSKRKEAIDPRTTPQIAEGQEGP